MGVVGGCLRAARSGHTRAVSIGVVQVCRGQNAILHDLPQSACLIVAVVPDHRGSLDGLGLLFDATERIAHVDSRVERRGSEFRLVRGQLAVAVISAVICDLAEGRVGDQTAEVNRPSLS